LTERTSPRISANKLGEYLVVSPVRRRSIVKDQKRPRDFIVARYTDVYPAICDFLVSSATDVTILERAIERLDPATATSEWQEQDMQLSLEALEAFLDLTATLDLSGYSVSKADPDPPQMPIAGVSISVRPDLLLNAAGEGGGTSGAVKLYLSKTGPLGEEAGLYVATTVHQYLTDILRPGGVPEARSCIVLDVFAREIHNAPRSFKRRRNDVEAACEEITRAWVAV
jgi:hypothetical protein